MTGLPQSLHCAVQDRSRVRAGGPEHAGELVVGEPGEELQGDDLALAGLERGHRGAHGGARRGCFRLVARGGRVEVLDVAGQRCDALAPSQLVQRRVAGDPEHPGPLASPPRVERPAAPVGALEGLGGDVFGGGAIAEQGRHVGEDVVPARAIEILEAAGGLLLRQRHGQGLGHVTTTPVPEIHHRVWSRTVSPARRAALISLALLAPLAAPATGEAAKTYLWATVNV